MARFLYKIGWFSATHRKSVVLIWLGVLAVVGAGMFAGPQTGAGEFEIPGTESSDALTTLSHEFPSPSDDGQGSLDLVFTAGGQVADRSRDITDVLAAVESVPQVLGVSDPLMRVSPDGDTAVSTVTYALRDSAGKSELHAELTTLADRASGRGLEVVVGGELGGEPPHILGPTEIVGVVVAFLVLLITFGSLTAAGVNMATALVGVGVGVLGVFGFSALSPIQPTTPILAVMLGLAVGIDYALFVIARFRSELRDGRDVPKAVARSIGTAGSAIVFAGATVIVALAGLVVVGVPFLSEMGLAAAFAVLVAVGVALTLLPTVLASVGMRVLSRRDRARLTSSPELTGAMDEHSRADSDTKATLCEQWGAAVGRRPWSALVPAVLVLGVLAVPVISLQTSLNVPGGADPDSDQRKAYDIVAEEFGAGAQSPLVILIEGDDPRAAASDVGEEIAGLPHLASQTQPVISADGGAALINVMSEAGPNDDRTAALVTEIRQSVGKLSAGEQGTTVSVTGQTAVSIDVDAKLKTALITYIVLIVGLALILLTVLFRSLLIPVLATVGFLLSLGVGMGASVAVFQWGWLGSVFNVTEGAPILSFLPIIVVGILFGLAMDYQVFLGSRIHEAHVRGLDTREAIIEGLSRSGPVVVAAAAIMAAVFAGFCLSGDPLVGSIAMALTVGVLVDALIVRMVIMPAALVLLGRRAWWLPKVLDRVLPRVDAEGLVLDGVDGDARDQLLESSAR